MDLALNYRIPVTQFAIDVTSRKIVQPFSSGSEDGSTLVERTDVLVTSGLVPEQGTTARLEIDDGLFESVKLRLELDDRGLLQAINSEVSRDLSPVLSLVSTFIPVLGGLVGLGGDAPAEGVPDPLVSLERQWANQPANVELAATLDLLGTRIEEVLRRLVSTSTPSDLIELGSALDVLQNQHAAIAQVRRTWVLDQATSTTTSYAFVPSDLPTFAAATLPQTVKEDALASVAFLATQQSGVCVALADRFPTARTETSPNLVGEKDVIWWRQPRPAVLGVYTRTGDAESTWTLDATSARALDIMDSRSPLQRLSVDARWFHSQSLEFGLHPDGSVKVFGIGTASTSAATVTALGGVVTAARALGEPADAGQTGPATAKAAGSPLEQLSVVRSTSAR